MRKPVSVKLFLSFAFFPFFFSPSCSHSAKPPLSPSLHSHSLVSDFRSVQVGCTRFRRCCYLIIDLCSLFSKGTGPGLSRSHLISAVELGSLDTISLSFFLLLSLLLFLSSCLSQFPIENFRD
jgi:hypothetical protein